MASYTLSEQEEKDAKAFIEKHKKCRPKPRVNNTFKQSAPYKYIFTPTGIGTSVTIKCPYCGKEKDITDVDCW
jgi:hypothetical protein